MNIVCIASVGHHSNFIVYNTEQKEIKYFSAERFFDYKKATMSMEQMLTKAKKSGIRNIDYIFISTCGIGELFSENDEQLFKYFEINKATKYGNKIKVFHIDHHYAHVLSAKAINNNVNSGIAIDGSGSYYKRVSIFKNLNDINKTKIILSERDKAIGVFLEDLSHNANIGEIGKLMGLQSYGKMDKDFYKKLQKIGITKEEIFDFFLHHNFHNTDLTKNSNFDKIYTAHQYAIDNAFEIFQKYFDKKEQIGFAGGCGLSIPLNSLLLDNGYNISVCPAANDSGISIGCLKFADMLLGLNIDFSNLVFSYGDYDAGYASDDLIKMAANLLADNEIIAWCQGKSEVGPRALGHRSFLMNPSIKNGKDYINEQIKHREWWRPFGGTIIDTSVIENYKPSDLDPFMLRTFKFKEEWKEKFQSIIHVDNTTRLQILTDKNDPFYKLIYEFYKITGIPGVLNTSYNLGGKPIANSLESIKNTFKQTEKLNHLFIGNKYFRK